ncbi:hypothetical protein PanWU01x14_293110 [Parasponia andersonii]|uniref:Transposase (putative) gypsy type domain-containing protein n=1 Tax=Parasponia andersonii TaxID=3476 RepID=A0A2P5AWU9_PARAD|nr:hypothetical protein PanWU01x14_293110 [Parasponia andersonii]
MRLPNRVERADSEVVGWTSFYVYTFKLGFTFPLPKLMRDVLIHFELALGQLMPNGWRLLMCLILMAEKMKSEFLLEDFLNCYRVKENPEGTGRYSFVYRKGQQLVNDFPSYPTSNDPSAVGLDSQERINKLKSAPIKAQFGPMLGQFLQRLEMSERFYLDAAEKARKYDKYTEIYKLSVSEKDDEIKTLKVERDSAIERVSDLEKHMVSKDESLLNAKINAQQTAAEIVSDEQNHSQHFSLFSSDFELRRGCFWWRPLCSMMVRRLRMAKGVNEGGMGPCSGWTWGVSSGGLVGEEREVQGFVSNFRNCSHVSVSG